MKLQNISRLCWQVPEQVQRQLCSAGVARLGWTDHEFALLQLLNQCQRQTHQTRQRLRRGV